MTKKQIERFWAKVNIQGPDDCWEWQSYLYSNGYGGFNLNSKMYGAHRVSYELTYGLIPEGLCCCHTCDNHRCVNPRHLFLGTKQDNSNDMMTKGRSIKGENRSHKLTKEQVIEIRRLYALDNNLSYVKLGILFDVSHTTIRRIVNKLKWKHI